MSCSRLSLSIASSAHPARRSTPGFLPKHDPRVTAQRTSSLHLRPRPRPRPRLRLRPSHRDSGNWAGPAVTSFVTSLSFSSSQSSLSPLARAAVHHDFRCFESQPGQPANPPNQQPNIPAQQARSQIMVEGFQTPFKASGTPGYDIPPSCCLLRNHTEFQVGSLQKQHSHSTIARCDALDYSCGVPERQRLWLSLSQA